MGRRRIIAAVLCLLLVCLTACHSQQPTAKDAVSLNGDTSVPCIDNTIKHNGKTMYEYYTMNPDTIGWLTIDGIKTDNVVMLGQDKE